MVKELDMQISKFKYEENTVGVFNEAKHCISLIEEYMSILYGLLIKQTDDIVKSFWYEPFKKNSIYDDTSYEGVVNTLERFKDMGINEVIISPFAQKYCLFESEIFYIYKELENYNYNEYGHDFLKCFIEEAHKRGIVVNAFTQTFAEHISTMKNGSEDYYQINFDGEKSKGNIYYYDICNDEVQQELITWYKELVSKYNFDKVEYDIIRYPDSNLYAFLEVDTIPETRVIKDHGYTTYSMNKFMEQFNLSGDLKELIKTNKEVRANWLIFKEQELVNFITTCTNEMRKIKEDIIVTAAVFSSREIAKNAYLQDYEKWLELNIIDEVEIMSYTPSDEELYKKINEARDLLSTYPVRIGISPRLDGGNLFMDLKQIMIASKYKGFAIWSSYLYEDEYIYKILKFCRGIKDINK